MTIEFDFADQNVLVIGGTSGINLGIAQGFARARANLGVVSRSQAKVDAAVAQLSADGAHTIGFSADVRDYEAIESCSRNFSERFGAIDVLISGAAGNFPATVNAMSANGFKAVVDIDLLGTFHVMHSAYPYLQKPGSAVINISAPQAFQPMEMQAHVCAAKAGVDMMTRVLAMEWGGENIRVNSIVPGPIADTEGMARLAPTREMQQAVTASVPLGRQGTTEDIAQAAMFLASPLASYITGAVIPVDGGWSLRGFASMGASLKDLAQN
ncbi:MAG: SDR family oxidoreductase [Arenicellales bacterium]|jgi:NAD(P)-dependent dehydrogenase (short-subunit alcohol dehydrogenase family)